MIDDALLTHPPISTLVALSNDLDPCSWCQRPSIFAAGHQSDTMFFDTFNFPIYWCAGLKLMFVLRKYWLGLAAVSTYYI